MFKMPAWNLLIPWRRVGFSRDITQRGSAAGSTVLGGDRKERNTKSLENCIWGCEGKVERLERHARALAAQSDAHSWADQSRLALGCTLEDDRESFREKVCGWRPDGKQMGGLLINIADGSARQGEPGVRFTKDTNKASLSRGLRRIRKGPNLTRSSCLQQHVCASTGENLSENSPPSYRFTS